MAVARRAARGIAGRQISPRTQKSRNEASVSAIREKAMWKPENATRAAAKAPAPAPNVRRASQAVAGIVRVPATIETRIAARSLTPKKR